MPVDAKTAAGQMETLYEATTFNDDLSNDTISNDGHSTAEKLTRILRYRHQPAPRLPTAHQTSDPVELRVPHPCPTVYALTNRHILAYRPAATGSGWCIVAKLPAARRRHAAVHFHGRIYVAGGLDDEPQQQQQQPHGGTRKVCTSFWSCDAAAAGKPAADCWFAEEPLPRPLCEFQLLTAHMQIYALSAATLLRYDPAVSRRWTTMRRMQRPRIGAAVTRHRNWLIAAGGRCEETGAPLRSVEAYDLVAARWRWWPPLRVARVFARAYSVVVARKRPRRSGMISDDADADVAVLCVCGGIGSDGKRSAAIDELWPEAAEDAEALPEQEDSGECGANRWRCVGDMQHARSHHSVAVLGTQVLIVGGRGAEISGDAVAAPVEGFCHMRRAWIAGLAQMPFDRAAEVCDALTDV